MTPVNPIIGRARAALVWNGNHEGQAVITTVVAQPRKGGEKARVTFAGVVSFDETCRQHIETVVLPTVEAITAPLSGPLSCLELSVANMSAAAAGDLGVCVSGFSLDLPSALAMLSCCLSLAAPQDVLCTGHIASTDGDLATVRAIPAKLRAAADDPGIRRFVMPDIGHDLAFRAMRPREKENIAAAVRECKNRLEIIEVANIAECLQAIFTDESIVLASLETGFFQSPRDAGAGPSPILQSIEFLTTGNETRFWQCLERSLLAEQAESARRFLRLWAKHFHAVRRYPRGAGRRLYQLVQSLPPLTRRLVFGKPLLSADLGAKLCRLASAEDLDDVRLLLDATTNSSVPACSADLVPKRRNRCGGKGETKALVDRVLLELSPETLANRIGIPADTARASYTLAKVTVDSYEEFTQSITAFVVHLYRHCRGAQAVPDATIAGAEAFALIERAFDGQGGVPAARAEARDAIRGGLRFVYDVLVERFTREEKMKFSQLVLNEAMDPSDFPARVRFMTALLKRLAPQLPQDIAQNDPSRYVKNQEEIIRAYLESIEQVRRLFRRL